ncbi:hypothetical protein O181_075069 [Austropuccinia psidii MF-1]|uniref:Uncharacterized protein n=1 Tax=Austropuccinia psidii MF-1 TaxID=1389203 RepID=A0A9Q3FAA5_9BASI|nr:hypothetical protein [Austropuccinia psidii MF-1]
MQEPYRAADQSSHLHGDGSNFAKWVSGLNQVLCIALNSELSVNDCPSLLENRSPQENREILHFIDATLPPNYALCIGIILERTMSKEFFNAIKARVLVENGAGHPKPNTTIILTLCQTFAIFKKLGVEADKLEGLLAQAACHAPPSLGKVAFDQLVTVAILAKGDEKLPSTFVGQIIMNASQKDGEATQHPSPFVYCVSEPLDSPALYS